MTLFRDVYLFEIKSWLRGMMVYVFLAIVALFALLATSSENVTIGGSENINLNSPYLVQLLYAIMAILGCGMVTAFVNSATTRDFSSNMHPIVFSQPIRKIPLLLGRFLGATGIACLPMLGVSLGILITGILPTNDAERLGPVVWPAHAWSWLVFVIPNTLLLASVIYAIATWTRSTAASFVGLLILLVGYTLSGRLTDNLEQEWIGAMLDPFGFAAFDSLTKYWTASEKNTGYVTLTGILLANRVFWLGMSAVIVGLATWRFSFAERRKVGRNTIEPPMGQSIALPGVTALFDRGTTRSQLISQFWADWWGMIRSPIFVVVMLFAMFFLITTLTMVADTAYGLQSYPVTYAVIDLIRGSMFIFLIALITYLAGALVWKDREARLNEVVDSLPYPTWITCVSKVTALVLLVIAILAVSAMSGMLVQTFKGFPRYQLDVYLVELFGWDLISFACLMILAIFMHVISPNKYVGYFSFIALMIVNAFVWRLLEIESNMIRFGSLPNHIYSDLFRWSPYIDSLGWFGLYWLLVAALLTILSILLWPRGTETRWSHRVRMARSQWRGGLRLTSVILLAAWLGSAGWVGYNTLVLNTWRTSEQQKMMQVNYEQKLKPHANLPQPRIVDVRYEIDLFPETQSLVLRGWETLKNATQENIDRLYYNTHDDYVTSLEIPDSEVEEVYPDLNYTVYRLLTPLEPGALMEVNYEVRREPVGFENQASVTEVVNNGTFFNNMIVPQLGYQSAYELSDKRERKKRGLAPRVPMPELNPDDLATRSRHYVANSSDWVMVESIISTSPDQIAVGPGSLLKSWEDNGRRYFHYRLDHPSLNFYAFVSAKYDVRRTQWSDVDLEVYYHPEHHWNVDNMVRSMRKSLEYYTEQFGPYRHKQARIIEFPRVASFAQAFPGTMPYSEGIGFIASLKGKDDIDMVYYVVAHEIAHQWWAHQVIGANMQGATLLSETLAQYSALMVMEREFGRDQMQRFLKYEMDGYLKGRGGEARQEQPLMKVAADQAYIHYQKGSVAMYYLKEMVGEKTVNAALRRLVDRFGYAEPPYPTAIDLMDAFRAEIPPDLHYLLEDLFERITLYDNRLLSAEYQKISDNEYRVDMRVSVKKLVSNEEAEKEVPMDDWIEIGALGKPEKGHKFGPVLHRERKRVSTGEHNFSFTVRDIPLSVGVDPFYLLIDRQPEDNTKRPKLKYE